MIATEKRHDPSFVYEWGIHKYACSCGVQWHAKLQDGAMHALRLVSGHAPRTCRESETALALVLLQPNAPSYQIAILALDLEPDTWGLEPGKPGATSQVRAPIRPRLSTRIDAAASPPSHGDRVTRHPQNPPGEQGAKPVQGLLVGKSADLPTVSSPVQAHEGQHSSTTNGDTQGAPRASESGSHDDDGGGCNDATGALFPDISETDFNAISPAKRLLAGQRCACGAARKGQCELCEDGDLPSTHELRHARLERIRKEDMRRLKSLKSFEARMRYVQATPGPEVLKQARKALSCLDAKEMAKPRRAPNLIAPLPRVLDPGKAPLWDEKRTDGPAIIRKFLVQRQDAEAHGLEQGADGIPMPCGPARPVGMPARPCACDCHAEPVGLEADSEPLHLAMPRGLGVIVLPPVVKTGRRLVLLRKKDAETCANERLGPRVLATKVDTLHLSFHVELAEAFLQELEKKKQEARENRRTTVTVKTSIIPWVVNPSGGGRFYSYRLSNEWADLLVSKARHKQIPTLRFELRSWFLWSHELEGAWGWCEDIARELQQAKKWEPDPNAPEQTETTGSFVKVQPKSVVTRLDMACDTTGADFAQAVVDDFVMRARKRTVHLMQGATGDQCPCCAGKGAITCPACDGKGERRAKPPASEALVFDDHASGLIRSGLSMGKSGISARIYDKTREIREKSKDKVWLYAYWAAKGWVSSERVWRVEIQMRRDFVGSLKTFTNKKTGEKEQKWEGGATLLGDVVSARTAQALHLDDLESLRDALSSLWGYAVGGVTGHTAWLKWCIPSRKDKRRSRWDPRPEWRVIQDAAWDRAEPFEIGRLTKKEQARGARYEQLLALLTGCTLKAAALLPESVSARSCVFQELERDIVGYATRFGDKWEERVHDLKTELATDGRRDITRDITRDRRLVKNKKKAMAPA